MKWLKSYELTREGLYLMHRTDDYAVGLSEGEQTEEAHLLSVRVGLKVNSFGNTELYLECDDQDVTTLDEEVRFFGPVPQNCV